MNNPIIEITGLKKIYRVGDVEVHALRGVDLTVTRGEFLSVVGPSGSGKSTLFHIVGGLTSPTSGGVVIDGQDMAGETRRRDPDDHARPAVEEEAVPQRVGVATEGPLPETIADHGDRIAGLFVSQIERPPHRNRNTQRLEVAGGGGNDRDPHRPVAVREVRAELPVRVEGTEALEDVW